MNDTQSRILDSAEALTQAAGYNGFSYRDLAERVGIRTASIHYHFPTKADLCLALIARHRGAMKVAFGAIDSAALAPKKKLEQYSALFRNTINTGNRMCLCGMLASDLESLSPSARDELQGAFVDHETWLAAVLEAGRKCGDFAFSEPATRMARSLFAGFEGALLVARTFNDPDRFAAMADVLLCGLEPRALRKAK